MYESSNELLKLSQNSSVRTKTHARIHVQYTPRVEQFWAVVPQRQKGRPGVGGTGAIHTSEVGEGAVCAAPAGQRSGVFVHRQRSGVVAFRQRWRGRGLVDPARSTRTHREPMGATVTAAERSSVHTTPKGRWGWGRTGSSRCSAAPGDLGQGPSVVRRYDREWTARVVTSPKTETQLERPEEASSQRVGARQAG